MNNLSIKKIRELMRSGQFNQTIYDRLVELSSFGNFDAIDLINSL